jgi:PAS domain S-box-containing protein
MSNSPNRTQVEWKLAHLAAIVSASQDAIIGKTLDGTVTSWNAAAEQLYGYTEDEALGQPVSFLLPPNRPDEIAALLAKIRQGEAVKRFNTIRRRKDGTLVEVSLTLSPIKDSDGQIVGALTVTRDITEEKRADAAVRESEQCIRAICDLALDAVVMVDASGKAVYWNPAAESMFGYSSDEMMGREVHAVLTPPRYRKRALKAFAEFTVSGQGRAVGRVLELTGLRKDGAKFPIEISVSGFRMFNQWCAAAIIRDITERKNAQQKLQQEQKALKLLLEASDHDRQLISCELHDGLAQQLAGAIMQFEAYHYLKEKSPEQAAKALDLGMQAVRDGHAEARRLIGGLRPPQLEESGILAAIESLVEECNKRNRGKIAFSSNVAQLKLAPMLENTIFRIVQECITNACRHSKSEKVTVELTLHDDQLRIEVRDWGVGFTMDRVGEGHFGLEGIQERAKVFGGRAVIKSSLRKGTDIVVELPLHSRSPASPR